MRDERDYKLDVSGMSAGERGESASNESAFASRPYLNVHFACCNIYLRVYRSADGRSYLARCPKCAKSVTFQVQPGGTDARIFRVT